jgi:glycosyltransferase involved in cell wall biosynthesis
MTEKAKKHPRLRLIAPQATRTVSMASERARYAVVIPACNEEACIRMVIDELRSVLDPRFFEIVVGVNGSNDATAAEVVRAGAMVAVTRQRGYGFGCRAAIDELARRHLDVDGYIFVAGDGANDPRDIARLVAEHQRGAALVLGCRTRTPGNWTPGVYHYVMANRCFGFLCGLLTGRFFSDLGPLRLIERDLFDQLNLREWTYGWTIEAQIRAALLGAVIVEIPVHERGRIAGTQKVSHESAARTWRVGLAIVAAAFRARFFRRQASAQRGEADAGSSAGFGGLNTGSIAGVIGVHKS